MREPNSLRQAGFSGKGHKIAGNRIKTPLAAGPSPFLPPCLSKAFRVSKVICMKQQQSIPVPDSSASDVPTIRIAPRDGFIVVPRSHGQLLFEPPVAALQPALSAAGDPFHAHSFVRTPPLQRLAAHARRDLYAALRQHAGRISVWPPASDIIARPWVITGHQSEFYHAGVWAKVLAADALARQFNGVAIDLIVDHDLLDEPGFAVPVPKADDNKEWEKQPVHWERGGNLPAQFIPAPRGRRKADWLNEIRRAASLGPGGQSELLQEILQRLERDAIEDFVPWLSAARWGLEKSLGLEVWHVPCSLICQGEAWLEFVLAWLANARQWADIYNAELQAYRTANGITNAAQPMPSLQIGPHQVELPFWIFKSGESRSRLIFDPDSQSVLINGGAIGLKELQHGNLAGQAMRFKALLASAGVHIRPRALTLTMFVRGFLADLFIHGIGGALYDRITDAIMRRLFACQPPYACVSAGWLLPFPQPDNVPPTPSFIRARQHHLRHNPDFAAACTDTSLPVDTREMLAALAKERLSLIARIADSLRAARQAGGKQGRAADSQMRRDLFRRLHEILAECRQLYPTPLLHLNEELARSLRQQEQKAVTHWREYFFALHSRESMEKLRQAIVERVKPMGG